MNVLQTLRELIHPDFTPVAIYKEEYPIDGISDYVLYGTTNDGEDYISLPLVFFFEFSGDNPNFFIKEPCLYIYTSLRDENAILENFVFQKLYTLWKCMYELYHYEDFPKLDKRVEDEVIAPNHLSMYIPVEEYKSISYLLLSDFHNIEEVGSSDDVIRYRITLVNGNTINIAYDYKDDIAYRDLMTYPRDSCGLESGAICLICHQAELFVVNCDY